MRVPLAVVTLLVLFLPVGALSADPIPLPRSMELEGLHAYGEKILSAGETIRFRVSSTVPSG